MNEPDATLQNHAFNALACDPNVDATHIAVIASQGIVTLLGSVKSFAHELAAVKVVRQLAGVRGVDDQLKLDLLPRTRSLKPSNPC